MENKRLGHDLNSTHVQRRRKKYEEQKNTFFHRDFLINQVKISRGLEFICKHHRKKFRSKNGFGAGQQANQ